MSMASSSSTAQVSKCSLPSHIVHELWWTDIHTGNVVLKSPVSRDNKNDYSNVGGVFSFGTNVGADYKLKASLFIIKIVLRMRMRLCPGLADLSITKPRKEFFMHTQGCFPVITRKAWSQTVKTTSLLDQHTVAFRFHLVWTKLLILDKFNPYSFQTRTIRKYNLVAGCIKAFGHKQQLSLCIQYVGET